MNRYIGFDPGGIGNFGWSVLSADGRLSTASVVSGTCSNADDAVSAASEALDGPPKAVGIDSPMFWVSSGDRLSDKRVRNAVVANGGYPGTVSHVNSLRGACLAQGIIVGRLARRLWPQVPITESHPKALLRTNARSRRFSDLFTFANDHERDAALGAFAAWSWALRADGWFDLRHDETKVIDLIGEPYPSYWFSLGDVERAS